MQLGKKAVLGKNLAEWQENKKPTVKERDAISWLRKCVCQAHLRPVYTWSQWLVWRISIIACIKSDQLGLQPIFEATRLVYEEIWAI